MKRFSLFGILLLLVFLFSCGKDQGFNPINNEFVINEKAISQDSTTFKTSIIAISEGSLKLNKNSSLSQEITEGSIIISDYGDGVCRYVLNIQESGEELILSTRTARLDEVIIQGRIEYKHTITPESIKNFSASEENIILQKSLNGNTIVDFGSWYIGGNKDISLDTKTEFTPPEITFIVEIDHGTTYMEASIQIENTTTVITEASANLLGGWTYNPQWAKFDFPAIPTPVPFLMIVPRIQFYLGISASISGSIKYQVTAKTNVLAGVKYLNENITSISDIDTDFGHEVYKAASGEIQPYVVLPKLGFYLNGMLGPFIELKEGIKYKNAINYNNEAYHGIYPTLAANWGGELDIFGIIKLKQSYNIFENEWTLFEEQFTGTVTNQDILGEWRGTFHQYAYGINDSYPMIMKVLTLFDNEFSGTLHWPTLRNSITTCEGYVKGDSLQWTEPKLLQGSNIILNGIYKAELIEKDKMVGKWYAPGNGPEGGRFEIEHQ